MNRGVIWFKLIFRMDLNMLPFLVLNSPFARDDFYVKEPEALRAKEAERVRAGCERWPKLWKADGGTLCEGDAWP